MKKRQVTIRDVAKHAGVSVGTVSLVMNGFQSSPETREKIMSAVADLNYVPNMHARAVRSARTQCIGMLVESHSANDYPYIQSQISHFIADATKRGYRAMLEYGDKNRLVLPEMLTSIDGLVVNGHFGEDFFEMLKANSTIPLVTGEASSAESYPNRIYLNGDVANGFRETLEHLWLLGHEKIAFIGDLGTPLLREKVESFRRAFAFYGRSPDPGLFEDVSAFSGTSAEKGMAAVLSLFERRPDCTAVVFDSDCTVLGALGGFLRLRIRIPEDCSIISFDDSDWASMIRPALTSIAPDRPESEYAVNALIDYLRAGASGVTKVRIPYKLVIRGTTAKKTQVG